MCTAASERDKILANRHEFILQYYNMAVQDLDRHLKVGWQTIAVVAGAIASISLGEQGHLPIFVSVSAALVVLYWGMQNVIDANFWALRAIAFLANVESVYFALTDRRHFNPYAGQHPPYKLMDSLKFQFSVCVVLIVGISIFFGYKLLLIAGDWSSLKSNFVSSELFKIFVWQFPIFVTLYYFREISYAWAYRHLGYRDFVQSSPGPGMASDLAYLRNVDFQPDSNDQGFAEGNVMQSQGLTEIQRHERRAEVIKGGSWWFFWISVIALIVFDHLRAEIFT